MKNLTFSTMARLAAAGPFPTLSIPQGMPMPTNVPKVPTPTDGIPLATGLPTLQGAPLPTLYPKTSAINGLPMPTLYPLGNGSEVPDAMSDFNHASLASAYPSMAGFPDYVPMADGAVLSPTQAAQWDWDLADFVPVYNGSVVPLPTPSLVPSLPINIDAVPTALVTAFPSYNFTGDSDVLRIDPPTIVADPEKNEYVVQVKGRVNETQEFIDDLQNNLPFLFPPVANATNATASCPSLARPQPTKYCHPEHCHNGHCHEKHCHKAQEISDLQKVDPAWVWSETSTAGPQDLNPCSQSFQRAHREQVADAIARLHQNATQNATATQNAVNRRRRVVLHTVAVVSRLERDGDGGPVVTTAAPLPTTFRTALRRPATLIGGADDHIHSSRSTETYFGGALASTDPPVMDEPALYPRPTAGGY
ncbi:hypothetical protein IWZ01DRAFT_483757 [Phyllosticta capitalensis]